MPPSERERDEFAARGVVRLPGAIPRAATGDARRAILGELERLGLKSGSKLASSRLQDLPPFQQTTHLGQLVKVPDALAALFPAELLAAMARLLPGERGPGRVAPQLLLTFPQKQPWSTEGLAWHLDLKVPPVDRVPGVQAFVLIDDVGPRGGATLALAGTHTLHHRPEAAGNAHSLLRRHGSIEALAPYGVSLVEMTGKAGDVYLMDMRVLHSPSLNASRAIRMMATVRLLGP
ncbi:MAG: hypothetical protein EOO75_10140 [Myxococcales bacterium]|nr:MAG: hypothetical protein EOO75_10140 [Myxococcales bacterium]